MKQVKTHRTYTHTADYSGLGAHTLVNNHFKVSEEQ